ncbi:Tetratricopeptide repeat protein 6 [Tupaia chinensis]|uniref:Tetratricopeptide repeat protein 6 n=1 Tax=Tupaia chinensis TaxID=246437 RepID=L9KPR3_TUPCH|nr:Tetratricopeptide repeat protein 6 [Tupaia chinensis]
MFNIPKHFGLKQKEESYMFKELEKIRQETRQDFLRFKQKLATKPAADEGSVRGLRVPRPRLEEKGRVPSAGSRKRKGSPPAKGPATSAAALLREALPGGARPAGLGTPSAPAQAQPFCPQDFYLHSSAFLRHRPQKNPPAIFSGVGTSRPVVLLPPPAPPRKPRGSAQRVAGGRRRGRETPRLAEARQAKERSPADSKGDSDVEPTSWRRKRVRIPSIFGRHRSANEARERASSVSRAEQEGGSPSDGHEGARPAQLPSRLVPKSIEEIIASLQSEAQQASDQIIKELIQSVLGQNYDIKMEVGDDSVDPCSEGRRLLSGDIPFTSSFFSAQCILYDPKRTDALLKRGIFYYENENWSAAIQDFTALLNINHQDSQARTLRGRAYFKRHFYKQATEDFSAAIHLDPNNWLAFYYRACIFRKSNPFRALQDYSVSGLIELTPIQQALIYSFCENHDKAIEVLDGISSSRPDITMYALLAKAHLKAKRTKEAMKMFKKALEVFSLSDKGPNAVATSADCLYNLGLCYLEEGNLQMAFEFFTKAVKTNPDFAEGFYQRGLCKIKLQKDNSILDFNRAITINPKHYQAYLSRVAFYGSKGRYSKAILNCNEAIRICPESVRAYLYRGVLKYYNKAYKLAITDLNIAVNMDKNNYVAFYNRALCYTKIKEFQMALIDYGIVLLLDAGKTVTLNTFINRGLIYRELEQYAFALETQGKFQKAWNHFTIAMEVDPKSYLAHEGRAVVCLQMGNNFAAMQDINEAIKINATAEFLTNRGVIHEFMGQKQNAMKDYQAAISLNPKYSLAYFNAGNIYFHHRQFSQVIDFFSKALMFDPENEFALMNRAIANTILKKYEEAKEDFACVIKSCPSWAAVYFNRAHFYCCLKQYELAEEDLSKALSLKPDDAVAYNLRAEVRGKIGLIEEAIADYNQALGLEDYTSLM